MNQEKRAILIIASRLLDYPSKPFAKQEIDEFVSESVETDKLRQDLKKVYEPLCLLSSKDIQELYVGTFDLKSKLGLYLTAHELGDSNKRGAALIKLQKIVNQAGFERVEGELADYMPMLFEFLAVAPDTKDRDRLFRRLAVAIEQMKSNLEEKNLYFGILQLLMEYVFPKPTEEEMKQLENGREKADLEELPYPIMYQ